MPKAPAFADGAKQARPEPPVFCKLLGMSALVSRFRLRRYAKAAGCAKQLLLENLRTSKDSRRPFVNHKSAILSPLGRRVGFGE